MDIDLIYPTFVLFFFLVFTVSSAPANRQIFPFGVIALVFVSISILGTLFLKHPAVDPATAILADYLFAMGLLALVIALVLNYDPTPPGAKQYNVFAIIISFLIGLGFIALFRSFPLSVLLPQSDEFFATFFFNEQLASLSTVTMPVEVAMFFVASIEELAFRVAIPSLIIILFPHTIGVELRWFFSILIASVLFGMWHLFAYGGNTALLVTAIIAGVLFSFAYRVGALAGGFDLAFLGIVLGHYFWNITMAESPTAILAMLSFMGIAIAFVFLLSPRSQDATVRFLSNVRRMIS